MRISAIFKGILFGIIIEVVVLLILAMVYYFNEFSDTIIRVVMYISIATSITLITYLISSNIESRPILHSLFVGLGCIISVMIISFSISGRININFHLLCVTFGCVLSSILGGVLGK